MSRVSWFAAGAVTGVYALVKTRNTARNFTPDGIAARAAALTFAFRVFGAEVRRGMTERESELRSQLALSPVTVANPEALSGAAKIPARAAARPVVVPARKEDSPDGHR